MDGRGSVDDRQTRTPRKPATKQRAGMRAKVFVKSQAMDGRGEVDDRQISHAAQHRNETASMDASKDKWSRPVSRVLCALRRDSHSSRPAVAGGLERPTRERRGPRHCSPIWSCFGWGLPCRSVARLAVGSCPTVSPLPDPLAGPSAVCSLLHYPSARAAQALPGTLPFEARTFLGALANDATVRPTPRDDSISRRTSPCAVRR